MFQLVERLVSKCPDTRPAAPLAHLLANPDLCARQTLLLCDQEAHAALVLSLEGATHVLSFRFFPLAPSAARVLLALLHAYPRHCSHQELFGALYPLPPGEPENGEHVWEKKLAIQPIRRALRLLLPMLRAIGLQVIALRGRGYMLASQPLARNSPGGREPPDEQKQAGAFLLAQETSGIRGEATQEGACFCMGRTPLRTADLLREEEYPLKHKRRGKHADDSCHSST